jgi:protein-S-isoprenylcysteine O-methyltransferase Ste14
MPLFGFAPMTSFLVRRRISLTMALIATTASFDLFFLRILPLDPLGGTTVNLTADVVIVVGLFLRAWAAGTIHKWEQLATTGPYAWIRHPLYLGSALILVGCWGLMHGPLFALALAPLTFIYGLAIRQEESYCARRYGNQWLDYADRVPSFFPPRIGWPQFGDWSLKQALFNREHLVWFGAFCGLLALAGWRVAL